MMCLQRSWPLAAEAEGRVRRDGLPLPMRGEALSPTAHQGSSGGTWFIHAFVARTFTAWHVRALRTAASALAAVGGRWRRVSRKSDRTNERPSDRAYERTIDRATVRSCDRATERPSDRATERPCDRATERPSDRTTERPSVRANDRSSDRATVRPSDRATERSSDRATVRSSDRAIERPSDRATERPCDRATERPSGRAIERSAVGLGAAATAAAAAGPVGRWRRCTADPSRALSPSRARSPTLVEAYCTSFLGENLDDSVVQSAALCTIK